MTPKSRILPLSLHVITISVSSVITLRRVPLHTELQQSVNMTRRYDRRSDEVSMDEVERIGI